MTTYAAPDRPVDVPVDARAAVLATNARFVAAIAARDAAAVSDVYAPEATLLAPDADPLHGRASIRAYWAAGIASGITSVALETVRLEPMTDGILETGAFALGLGDGSGARTLRGKYLVVHRRQPDGTWAWETDIFNANGAPA